jgi:hypothetical protein
MYRDFSDMSLGAAVVDSGDKNSTREQGVNSRVEFKNKGDYNYERRKCFNCGKPGHLK